MPTSGDDTSSLRGHQLSVDEISAINAIEQRLLEAKAKAQRPIERARGSFTIPLLDRDPRVLLLDGERGTGKTSVLLTLIERWQGGTRTAETLGLKEPPTHVTVVGNLDFDPLPPDMPLIAGVVQAWKPLIEAIEEVARNCDEPEHIPLTDRWHSLFRMAASWSDAPSSHGLIDQILEREDQVQDWLKLSEKWREFVDHVACEGAERGKRAGISTEPVFVIIVDDCDLQVSRIRELLPTLRNLYHERVFFLVAAEKQHMLDMLKLDFAGQQAKLISGGTGAVLETTDKLCEGHWPTELAYATFQKVFTRDNQWRLQRLSLRRFLAYPEQPNEALPGEHTFYSVLAALPSEGPKPEGAAPESNEPHLEPHPSASPHLGDFMWNFAAAAEAAKLPAVMTYRGAHQLNKYVNRIRATKAPEADVRAAQHVLMALFSGRRGSDAATIQNDQTVDVPVTGELASLFRPKAIEFARYNVVFGTRPDFTFLGYEDSIPKRMSQAPLLINWTALLVAKALEERRGPVDAAGIRWDSYLSLAWTEWQRPPASFQWNRHRHPRPDELLSQAEEWADCVRELGYDSNDPDRVAYAWIYYQIKWNNEANALAVDLNPLAVKGQLPWSKLLKLNPKERQEEWRNETLPLLARPELGFSPYVQRRLLSQRVGKNEQTLKKERRRYITNAVIALAAQEGNDVKTKPKDDDIDTYIKIIEDEFSSRNSGRRSPWHLNIEIRKKKPEPRIRAI